MFSLRKPSWIWVDIRRICPYTRSNLESPRIFLEPENSIFSTNIFFVNRWHCARSPYVLLLYVQYDQQTTNCYMKLFIWKRFRDEEGVVTHLGYTNNNGILDKIKLACKLGTKMVLNIKLHWSTVKLSELWTHL